ncbi:MAG: transposase [Methylocella sp.]
MHLSGIFAPDTACFQNFLDALAKTFPLGGILLVLDGAPNHHDDDLVDPATVARLFLPPYVPRPNPKENIWTTEAPNVLFSHNTIQKR